MNMHAGKWGLGLAMAGYLWTQAAQADLLIGVAGPMTGPYASGGEQMRNGAERAIADINARGGVLGQPLKLVVGDDVCDPKQAVAVANTLVNKGVVFVDGHYCSSSTMPASEVYADEGISMATISTNPQVTERGLNNLIRVVGRDDQQGGVAAQYLARHFAGRKIAVVDDKSAYGKGLADEVDKGLRAQGLSLALRTSITAGEKDYNSLVSRMKAAGIEVLAYGGYYTELGLILRQAAQSGLKLTTIGGDTLTNSELLVAGGAAADGTLFTFGPDPRTSPAAAEIVASFRQARIEPEGYTLYSYAAVQLFAQAAQLAGSTKVEDIRKAWSGQTFDTVVGPLAFDAKGDITQSAYVVYRWSGNQYGYAE
ncbi:branched-chain amino acid ABC transporter substrate-binding protein [Pseudomonas japonica]|uniref:Amino acid/amide ABC transporter substrate-binding protein, HAAT family n=1 Tax=Pseudomonas japonica TaxID=256466 RepID=A0A239LEA1_9PSED|nr:branched-chain amino acid ABC transporter substrate-binding protein [Pseudomonas japonica]SNT27864.1 amino acid/amide ABC transporter substrate-binding protein, HAAT family [Pseudomonas japonica]